MNELRQRVEQAVLGALLTSPERARDVEVSAGDFTDPRHQAIFAAIVGSGQRPGGVLGKFREWLTNLRQRGELRGLASYLDTLPGACPDPGNLLSYIAMLSETRARAGQAASGTGASATLAHAANWLTTGAREPAAISPGMPADAERLGRALRARTFHPARPAPPVASAARPEPQSAAPGPAGTRAVRPAGERRPMTSQDLEDLVLADLLTHPASGREVTGWLPDAAFAPGPRRQLYTLLRTRIAGDKPVDPLIVAWEAGRLPAVPQLGEQVLDAALVLRIASLDTPPGTAAELGRRLLADHWCATVLGGDWHTRPLPASVDPDVKPAPEPAADPRPQAAAEPGPQLEPSGSLPSGPEKEPGFPVLTPPPGPEFREPTPRL